MVRDVIDKNTPATDTPTASIPTTGIPDFYNWKKKNKYL